MNRADLIIVGAGVIGLSVAYQLARRAPGSRILVLDRGQPGREASWAGAGLICPTMERPAPDGLSQLRSRSAALYPIWSSNLLEETGLDNGYRCNGGLDVAWTEKEDHDLKVMAGRWRKQGIVCERLEASDIARVVPGLAQDLRAAYFLPDRAQVRNPRHLRALEHACRRRGVVIRNRCPAHGFQIRSGRLEAVQTDHGPIPCGGAVITAGAQSGPLLDTIGVSMPTPPIKGQILMYRGRGGELNRIVEYGKSYLVPRDDGRILMGATEHIDRYDTRPTSDDFQRLHDEAIRLCPTLGTLLIEATWAGLRPGSRDRRPYLGPVPGASGLFVATGHARVGLQLSPATAEVITDLILDAAPLLPIDLGEFAIDRQPITDTFDLIRS